MVEGWEERERTACEAKADLLSTSLCPIASASRELSFPRRSGRLRFALAGKVWFTHLLRPFIETLSSSGLGHRPFTAVTRVRIPLGSLLCEVA